MSGYEEIPQDTVSTSGCCPCEPAIEVEPAPVVEEIAPAPVEEVAPASVEEVAPAPVEEIAPAPVEQYAAPVVEEVAPAPVEQYSAPAAEAPMAPELVSAQPLVINAAPMEPAGLGQQGFAPATVSAPAASADLGQLMNTSSQSTGVSVDASGALVIGHDPSPTQAMVFGPSTSYNPALSQGAQYGPALPFLPAATNQGTHQLTDWVSLDERTGNYL